MEFIGKHCSIVDCNYKDFLPITCSFCQNIFCTEHGRALSHKCAKAPLDNQVAVCPLCEKPVEMAKKFQTKDEAVDHHISNDCKVTVSKTKSQKPKKCHMHRCKEKVILFSCSTCERLVCAHHRNVHGCDFTMKRNNVCGMQNMNDAEKAKQRRVLNIKA